MEIPMAQDTTSKNPAGPENGLRHNPRHRIASGGDRKFVEGFGRGEWIRITDLLVPNLIFSSSKILENVRLPSC